MIFFIVGDEVASVLVDLYEVMALVICLSSLFDADSVSDVVLKISPTLEISGFRDMRHLFFKEAEVLLSS